MPPSPPSPPPYALALPALNAILAECTNWHTTPYDPPTTPVSHWLVSLDTLFDIFGIPPTQRPLSATKFIKSPQLTTELEKALHDAQSAFGPIHWSQFKVFITAFDRDFRKEWDELPFYKKHPKATGAALGVTGAALLAPVAIVGVLSAVGFTSAGVAAGSLAATIQSIIYGGATGGLFSLLQSAGATMVLPSLTTIIAGTASTATGIALSSDHPPPSSTPSLDLLSNNTQQQFDNTPVYLLTPSALHAILKSWNITPYIPPSPPTLFLSTIQSRCDEYGVPPKQHSQCAIHHLSPICRQHALAAGCNNLSWLDFESWLLKYHHSV